LGFDASKQCNRNVRIESSAREAKESGRKGKTTGSNEWSDQLPSKGVKLGWGRNAKLTVRMNVPRDEVTKNEEE
jgi:hypothetical protein